MKFIETNDGSILNFNYVSKIEHDQVDSKSDKYYSYVYLVDGSKYEFFDLPSDIVNAKGKKVDFDASDIVEWHKAAVECILKMEDNTIYSISDLEDESWQRYIDKKNSLCKE